MNFNGLPPRLPFNNAIAYSPDGTPVPLINFPGIPLPGQGLTPNGVEFIVTNTTIYHDGTWDATAVADIRVPGEGPSIIFGAAPRPRQVAPPQGYYVPGFHGPRPFYGPTTHVAPPPVHVSPQPIRPSAPPAATNVLPNNNAAANPHPSQGTNNVILIDAALIQRDPQIAASIQQIQQIQQIINDPGFRAILQQHSELAALFYEALYNLNQGLLLDDLVRAQLGISQLVNLQYLVNQYAQQITTTANQQPNNHPSAGASIIRSGSALLQNDEDDPVLQRALRESLISHAQEQRENEQLTALTTLSSQKETTERPQITTTSTISSEHPNRAAFQMLTNDLEDFFGHDVPDELQKEINEKFTEQTLTLAEGKAILKRVKEAQEKDRAQEIVQISKTVTTTTVEPSVITADASSSSVKIYDQITTTTTTGITTIIPDPNLNQASGLPPVEAISNAIIAYRNDVLSRVDREVQDDLFRYQLEANLEFIDARLAVLFANEGTLEVRSEIETIKQEIDQEIANTKANFGYATE